MENTNITLFIQLRDGQPFEHPIFYRNFIEAFPDIDPDNLPADRFAKFVRVNPPKLGMYEVLESDTPSYELVDGVVKDVWKVRPMTTEEKLVVQQKFKDVWATHPQAENWATWTFNEDTCKYDPPIPRPPKVEGKSVFWCGADNNWKEAPQRPEDGKPYMFDFFAWKWVEVTSVK